MARSAEHTHRVNIRETQLEMSPDAPVGSSALAEDYDGHLQMAQEQLEQLQQQREELEQRKKEIEELNQRKKTFLGSQAEITEKLTNTVTMIDRELFAMRKENEELEGARQCFAEHISRINRLDPETWSRQNVGEALEQALASLQQAEDDFKQAAQHFNGMRSGTIFGRGGRKHRAGQPGVASEFITNLRNGFAFNLPVVLLGIGALVVYFLK